MTEPSDSARTGAPREVVVSVDALLGMSHDLRTPSDASHPDRLVQELGRSIGKSFAGPTRAALAPDPLRAGQEAFWAAVGQVLDSRRWGQLTYLERAGQMGLVEVRSWAEKDSAGRRWFLTIGLLEGLLSDLVGRSIAVEDLGDVEGEPDARRFAFGPDAVVRRVRQEDGSTMDPMRTIEGS